MRTDTSSSNSERSPGRAQTSERIAVVIGSTRPTRICPGIAEYQPSNV